MKNELARLRSEIANEIRSKLDEEGEFLSNLTSHSPHLYKRAYALLDSYNKLLFRLNEENQEIKFWRAELDKIKKLENALYHEVHSMDTGSH